MEQYKDLPSNSLQKKQQKYYLPILIDALARNEQAMLEAHSARSKIYNQSHRYSLSLYSINTLRFPIHFSHNHGTEIQTCNNIEALAHMMPPPRAGSPSEESNYGPSSLLGDELMRMVTSSIPSLPIIDHPSSVKPLTASLKPLQ